MLCVKLDLLNQSIGFLLIFVVWFNSDSLKRDKCETDTHARETIDAIPYGRIAYKSDTKLDRMYTSIPGQVMYK